LVDVPVFVPTTTTSTTSTTSTTLLPISTTTTSTTTIDPCLFTASAVYDSTDLDSNDYYLVTMLPTTNTGPFNIYYDLVNILEYNVNKSLFISGYLVKTPPGSTTLSLVSTDSSGCEGTNIVIPLYKFG